MSVSYTIPYSYCINVCFRFKGLFMPIPFIAITMLFVFLLQMIIRLWMLNSPKWERKCVRKPVTLSYGLPDAPSHGYVGDVQEPAISSYAYSNQGYMSSRNYVRSGYSTPGYAGYAGYSGQYLQPSRQYARQY